MLLKKSAFLGFIFLLTGIALLGWLLWQEQISWGQVIPACTGLFPNSDSDKVEQWAQKPYNNQEKYDQILEELQAKPEHERVKEQEKRLAAHLEMLVACPPKDPLLAQALYGKGWDAQVNTYRQQKQRRERLLKTSLVLTASGILVFLLCLLSGLIGLIFRRVRTAHRHDPDPDGSDMGIVDSDAPVRTEMKHRQTPEAQPAGGRPKLGAIPNQTQDPAGVPAGIPVAGMQRSLEKDDSLSYKRHHPVFNEYCLNDLAGVDSRVSKLFTDDTAPSPIVAGPQWQSEALPPSSGPAAPPQADAGTSLRQTVQSETERVEQQIDAFKEMAQSVQAPADAQSAPMNKALLEMSAQISAIRDYAASQQDRVEKLQNGYDWNIIRQFALRIIRCVDNLEQRMDKPSTKSHAVEHLTDIRDELLFALESSGIEQFVPELDSPYSGQERGAEAVKEKEPCTEPDRTGTIAAVVKPGYQYVIDEENAKVVRTARVKLYG